MESFILFRRRSGNHHRSGEASHYTEYEHYVIARLLFFRSDRPARTSRYTFRLFGRDDEGCLLPTGPGIHAFHEREFLLYTYQTRNHTPHPENDRGKHRHLCRQGKSVSAKALPRTYFRYSSWILMIRYRDISRRNN